MTVEQFLYPYIAKEETYEDDAIIIEEGVKGDWVYVILKGRAQVKKRTEKGMVTLYKLKEGDIFGEIAFLERGEGIRSASVIAAEGSVCVRMPSLARTATLCSTWGPFTRRHVRRYSVRN
jgi:CRP-like cAMP-binding protein